MRVPYLLLASIIVLTACTAPTRPRDSQVEPAGPSAKPASDLPLRVIETLHGRLKERCTQLWIDMSFEGGLRSGPGWGRKRRADTWTWEFSRFTLATPSRYGPDWPIVSWDEAREQGTEEIGSVSLHRWDDRQRELRLVIADESVTVFILKSDATVVPNALHVKGPQMTLAQLIQTIDDSAWSGSVREDR